MADTEAREYNPRWKGYLYILVSSLVNFAGVSNLNVEEHPHFQGLYQVSLMFGIVTFGGATLILIFDRFQSCCDSENMEKINYTRAMDGKVEGYTLLAFALWWIVGVAYITQVDGVAYVATNIYFSAWSSLFSCVYTLDKWSTDKDILSIQELTGLSATLKSWYVLFLTSLVTMGTSGDMHVKLSEQYKSSATYGILLGLFSTLISLFFILVHYRIVDFDFLKVGGWTELSASFCMILIWVIGVSILTSEGGIAATIGGSGCTSHSKLNYETDGAKSCYVVWVQEGAKEEVAQQIADEKETLQPTQAEPVTENPAAAPTDSPTRESTPQPTNSEVVSEADQESKLTPVPSVADTETDAPETFLPWNATNSTPETFPPWNATNSTPTDAPTQALTEGEDNGIPLPTSNETLPEEGNEESELTQFPSEEDTVTAPPDTFRPSNATNSDVSTNPDSTQANIDISDGATVTVTGNRSTRWLQQMDGATVDGAQWTAIPTPGPTRGRLITMLPSSSPSHAPYKQQILCDDVLARQIPGSNLYLSCWICFIASFSITLRWKAAQAIQFAQAAREQNRRNDSKAILKDEEDLNASEREDDDPDTDGDNM